MSLYPLYYYHRRSYKVDKTLVLMALVGGLGLLAMYAFVRLQNKEEKHA